MWFFGRSSATTTTTRMMSYYVLPDGAKTGLVMDIAVMHHIQPPLSHAIVSDVLRHHSDLARAGRLIRVQIPIGLPHQISHLPNTQQRNTAT